MDKIEKIFKLMRREIKDVGVRLEIKRELKSHHQGSPSKTAGSSPNKSKEHNGGSEEEKPTPMDTVEDVIMKIEKNGS